MMTFQWLAWVARRFRRDHYWAAKPREKEKPPAWVYSLFNCHSLQLMTSCWQCHKCSYIGTIKKINWIATSLFSLLNRSPFQMQIRLIYFSLLSNVNANWRHTLKNVSVNSTFSYFIIAVHKIQRHCPHISPKDRYVSKYVIEMKWNPVNNGTCCIFKIK